MNNIFSRILAISGLLLVVPAKVLAAEGTVTFEMLKPETALTAAQAALVRCREEGFQAIIAVVDRFGGVQVVLRDQLASPRTIRTVIGKARTAECAPTTPLQSLSSQAMKIDDTLSRYAGREQMIEFAGHQEMALR